MVLIGVVLIGLGAWALWTISYVPSTLPPEMVDAATPVSYTVLAQGEDSSVELRKNYLISDEFELRELWKLITTNEEPPPIDFTTESVIAVFTGVEPTPGFSISVIGIEDTDRRVVKVHITVPGISCLAPEKETTPYQVVKMPKSSLPLTHENSEIIVGCIQ
jgi:hypothetical protein